MELKISLSLSAMLVLFLAVGFSAQCQLRMVASLEPQRVFSGSCKSRLEVKVREVATGNIFVTDRQTSVGVDVAEQTAAKTALQNATDALAERIIPQLTK